ncbi:MAG: Gfo/Idh/MocA family oxidoreductase [Verrucomicrobiota bacterium]
MTRQLNRRQFLRRTIAASALAFPFVSSRNVLGANQRLNVAAIGCGGKGAVDIGYCADENIVALCDVDDNRAAGTYKKFPAAKQFKDFRVMLEKEGRNIDAVTISTPDHLHAVQAAMAIRMGKHVYLQKPMTHSVYEARYLTLLARKHKVVTQMGNQGHSHPESRRMVELIQAGVLGQVSEIHVWTDRPIWPQGIERPVGTPPVPATLDWDLWLGPAPERPYHTEYAPFKWRGFWDFGTGALGDMGCHNMDLSFFALNLRDPVSVEATSSGANSETAPKWSIITYNFPRRGQRPPVELTWYDGGKKPSPELVKEKELPGNGSIYIGDEDTLYIGSYWGAGKFQSGAKLEDFKEIPQKLPRFPGAEQDHDRAQHLEWIAACKGEGKALANFDYAGPMTEAVLLGNVALRVGKKIQWDASKVRVTNAKEAAQHVRREYRKGWKLEG